jgi:hypothetical protein
LTGDWTRVQSAYDYGPLGQTADAGGFYYYGTRGALVTSGVAAATAGGLMMAEMAGITDIGSARMGWRGGEITFTRPGASTPDWRVSPFGGHGHPPHYHRRPGIGKHRPWQGGW